MNYKTLEYRVYEDGTVEYRNANRKLHREDGPAVIYANGDQFYYQNGKLHREDGPAVIFANGDQYYCQNGEQLSEQEFKAQKAPCNGKTVEIEGVKYLISVIIDSYQRSKPFMNYQTLEYRVYEDGTIEYRNANGKLHRDDGPAAIRANGYQYYYQNGERHRDDGPAIIRANGDQEYWKNGEQLSEQEFKAQKAPCNGKTVEIEGVKYRLTAL